MKKVTQVIRDVSQQWVGDGFPVRNMFTYGNGNQFDPFLVLGYTEPYEFPPAKKKRGVGAHPHKGFEVVTILYQGELAHRDSSGSSGLLGPGDVQWMTAGNGIVHEEFHGDEFTRNGGTLELVQLWVNLPARAKSTAPKYQDLRDKQFPRVALEDGAGEVRVISGEFNGVTGPAETFSDVNVWDVTLNAAGKFKLAVPEDHTCLLMARTGEMLASQTPLNASELAQFEREGDFVVLETDSAVRALVLTGEPLGEPVVGHGPFVMNTQEEIQQAIKDFQAGKMGSLT